jgi:hypothetical protein
MKKIIQRNMAMGLVYYLQAKGIPAVLFHHDEEGFTVLAHDYTRIKRFAGQCANYCVDYARVDMGYHRKGTAALSSGYENVRYCWVTASGYEEEAGYRLDGKETFYA